MTNLSAGREMEHTLIQSYVCEEYFVSTIYRRSSAELGPKWYYETIVWKWNKDTRTRGKMLEMHDSGLSPMTAIDHHYDICRAALASKEGE